MFFKLDFRKKLSANIFLSLLFCILFFSCKTIDWDSGKTDYSETVDYTSEDVIDYEIQRLKKDAKNNSMYSLWRISVLENQNPGNENIVEARKDVEAFAFDDFCKYLESGNILAAKNCYDSFRFLSFVDMRTLNEKIESLYGKLSIDEVFEKNLPRMKKSGANDGASVKGAMASYVNATVTVYENLGYITQGGYTYPNETLGSGFFISRDGYIVTNHHVISHIVDTGYKGYAKLYVTLAQDPETKIPAKVIGYDAATDLALLKVPVDAPEVLALGDTEELYVGQKVYAIGSPLGLQNSVSSGIISTRNRNVGQIYDLYQFDAALNGGNSGGPLIDERGNVVAINSMKSVSAGNGISAEGLSYAIPVDYLKKLLPVFMNRGRVRHSWLGLYGKTKRLPGAAAKNEGVYIYYVAPESCAGAAGVYEGDTIVAVNGKRIYSLEDFHFEMLEKQPGLILELTVEDSSGNEKRCLVYTQVRPERPSEKIFKSDLLKNAMLPIMGAELESVSTKNRNQYSIKKIIKGSQADELGFSEGDPVEIADVQFFGDYIEFLIKSKRIRNGYLDAVMQIYCGLDSRYYF